MKSLNEPKLNIHVIILGAGFSRRYSEDENKLKKMIDGKPMYRHITDKILSLKARYGNFKSVTFVTQTAYLDISQELKKDRKEIDCIFNGHPERGISSSMQVGLAYALKLSRSDMAEGEIRDIGFDNSNAFLFTVADQPNIEEKTIERFLAGFIRSDKGIGAFSVNNVAGNPVIFKEKYVRELMELTGDQGGKKVLNAHPNDTYLFEVDSNECEDIDYK